MYHNKRLLIFLSALFIMLSRSNQLLQSQTETDISKVTPNKVEIENSKVDTDKVKKQIEELKQIAMNNYHNGIKEQFSSLINTSWLAYSNKQCGETQINTEPLFQILFKEDSAVLMFFSLAIIRYFDYKLYEDYSLLIDKDGAKFKFNMRMLSSATMISDDGSMIFHKLIVDFL